METINDDERVKLVTIDLSRVTTPKELQYELKTYLDFPSFYGMNWDAFWDTITGLVEMPEKLILNGWSNIIQRMPEDAKIMKELLDKLNEKYPSWGCNVEYK